MDIVDVKINIIHQMIIQLTFVYLVSQDVEIVLDLELMIVLNVMLIMMYFKLIILVDVLKDISIMVKNVKYVTLLVLLVSMNNLIVVLLVMLLLEEFIH